MLYINDNTVYQYQSQSNPAGHTLPPYQDRAKIEVPVNYKVQNPLVARTETRCNTLARITAVHRGNYSSDAVGVHNGET